MADSAPLVLSDCPKCGLPAEFVMVVDGAFLLTRYGMGYPGVDYTVSRCVALHVIAEAPLSV